MRNKTSFRAVVLALVVLLVGSSGVFAQEASCTDCHNDTTVITGKQFAMEGTLHATGTSAAYAGGRSGCTACHSGASFSAMVAAELQPDEVSTVTDITRQDCRACHQIHTSNTGADWALETVAPVTLYAFEDVTYDGGTGNLCAICHQPRREIAEADVDGNIAVTSTHWGPHHGPQSAMLLGIGGAGAEGEASLHSSFVGDTCVSCHLGAAANHTFEPDVAACVGCHEGAENFDIGGLQTDVAALIAEVGEMLIAQGLLDEEGHPVVGVYPAAKASALWDYIFIVFEDGSLGVHNPSYTKALLEAAKAALQ